jgi:hypothetical protein
MTMIAEPPELTPTQSFQLTTYLKAHVDYLNRTKPTYTVAALLATTKLGFPVTRAHVGERWAGASGGEPWPGLKADPTLSRGERMAAKAEVALRRIANIPTAGDTSHWGGVRQRNAMVAIATQALKNFD